MPVGQFLVQVVDLATRVAEDDRLGDRHGLVDVAQGADLPLLTLNVHVELLDTLKGELLLLHQDASRVAHEALADFQHIWRHGGRQQNHLHVRAQGLEDVMDLVLETARQHLIGLVQHEHLDARSVQGFAANHIEYTARSADNDVRARFQLANVLANVGAANAGVALSVQELAQIDDDLLDLGSQFTSWGQNQGLALRHSSVDALQDRD